MARAKGELNKSDLIRDYFRANPEATGKEVQEALNQQGIKVTSSLIYQVKGAMRERKRQRRRKARRVARAARSLPASNAVELVSKVQELAKQAGGIENLQKLVAVMAV